MVARILVTANVEGAAIFIDEEYVATAPLSAPIEVAPGERRVSVRAPGYADAFQVVQAEGHPVGEEAEAVRLEFELEEQRVAGGSTGGVSNAVRYSVLGVGGAFVAVAGVTSGLWASAHTDLDAYCSNGVCANTSAARDARDRFRTMRLTSIVAGGVGVAAIVTALVLPRGHEQAVTTDVACDSTYCGAQLTGRF